MNHKNNLNNMTLEELGLLFPIKLTKPCTSWAKDFKEERQKLFEAIGKKNIRQIDHIGSTAIGTILSKPTIDILLQITKACSIQHLTATFQRMGSTINEIPDNPPPHLLFVKGYSPGGYQGQTYHVHVRYAGKWPEIPFRDYLIQHPDVAKTYEKLKIRMAAQYKFDREAYTNSIGEFVRRINALIASDQ